jgi:hypothetical protein
MPGGAVNELGISAHASRDQADWEAQINGQWAGQFNPVKGFRTSLLAALMGLVAGPLQFLSDLFSLRWAQVDDITEVQVPRLDNRIDALAGIGSRSTFYSNGTWPNPGQGVAMVAVFNGGKPGGADGGDGAKYLFQEFNCADLPSSVTVTVGASNVASSFGTHLVGSWTVGGVVTAQGILSANNDAAHGGVGHRSSSPTRASTAGEPTYWATGGARGTSGAGGAGGDAPIDRITVVGGGGGGGGGFTGGVGFILGQDGGDGGWPGGGGGGYGQGNLGSGDAGLGGYGGVFVTVRGA